MSDKPNPADEPAVPAEETHADPAPHGHTQADDSETTDVLERVVLRNQYYKEGYKKIMGAFLLSLLLNIALVLLNFYQFAHKPTPRYFAATANGRILPLYPFTDPVLSKPVLLQWAQRAIIASNSFDFLNYREQMNTAAQYYSEEGWQAYLSAQKKAGNLRTVLAKKLATSAVATGAPVIVQEGVLNGRYMWRIQMPILTTYESGNQKITVTSLVTILVHRDSTLNYPRGISIVQYVAQERASTPT